MNTIDDAIDELNRATEMLEQVLGEHLDAMRRERENMDTQQLYLAAMASEKQHLTQEIIHLRAVISRYQHLAQENGNKILIATQKIRSTLAKI